MKNFKIVKISFFTAFLLESCASKPVCEPTTSILSAGFIEGFIHGLALPFAIIGNIIGQDCGLYALRNDGLLYWIGFAIGAGLWAGGSSKAKR
jgi:hypothetical protein